MAVSTPIRTAAFKKADNTYYIFNESGTMLIAVGAEDYNNWMDTEKLSSYASEVLRLVSGMTLCIHSFAADDSFNTTIKEYGIEESTDSTNINLKGFAGINKITAVSTGDCRYAFSFDGRKTYQIYDSTKDEWIKVLKEEIVTKGMTSSVVNSLGSTIWGKIFVRTNLDYIITVPSDGSFSSITADFPPNTAPVIKSVSLSCQSTHKDDVNLNVKIEDVDGDDMTYKLFVGNETIPRYQGNVNPLSHGNLNFLFPSDKLIVGINRVRIVMTDEKGATSEKSIDIVRTNDLPRLNCMVNNDMFSITIVDSEGDNIQYRVLLNDEEIVPMTEFMETPIETVIKLPRDKIKFGVKNHLRIEYQDDVKEDPLCAQDIYFDGYYYGILFASDNLEDKKNPDGSLSNERFYSDSLRNVLKKLIFKNLYRNGQSSTEEIFVLNRSNSLFPLVKVKPEAEKENVVMEFSEQRTPFEPKEEIEFSNLAFGESRSFFVRLRATNSFTGNYSNTITAEAIN